MTDDTFSNQRPVPDPEKCRTMYLEQFPELSKCMVKDPDACEFSTRIGSVVYCYHPDRFGFESSFARLVA